MSWGIAAGVFIFVVVILAIIAVALRKYGAKAVATLTPTPTTYQPTTQSPIRQAIMADPSTITGAAIQGFKASGSDASFFMTAPGTIQADAGTTWQYCNVGIGYTLQLLGSGVLNPICHAGFTDFGNNGVKITGFTLAKP